MQLKTILNYVQKQPGFVYATIRQIDAGFRRLLWIGRDRKIKTLLRFFRFFGKQRTASLRYICSDMWKPYLRVVAKKANLAIHVLDRFHIVAHMNKAIDEVRAGEARALKAKGYEPVLTRTRWLFLKRPQRLTGFQQLKLADLLRYKLRSVRAYLLKEQFQIFWAYTAPERAAAFLDQWCTKTMRSRIEPMKKVARMLRAHRALLLNWFHAKGLVSAGPTEGFNKQGQTHRQKSLRFQDLQSHRSYFVSQPWRPPSTGGRPQILLRRGLGPLGKGGSARWARGALSRGLVLESAPHEATDPSGG